MALFAAGNPSGQSVGKYSVIRVRSMSRTGQKQEPTLDGRRTDVAEMGIDQSVETEQRVAGLRGRLARLLRNLNLVAAGMYTGLSCYGTPHSRRPVEKQVSKTEAQKRRDLV